ncbi:hypothetical protein L6R52_01250 [Myxococcota bacterium]|nr:hypothetical protein [Myxococcota bacterium]
MRVIVSALVLLAACSRDVANDVPDTGALAPDAGADDAAAGDAGVEDARDAAQADAGPARTPWSRTISLARSPRLVRVIDDVTGDSLDDLALLYWPEGQEPVVELYAGPITGAELAAPHATIHATSGLGDAAFSALDVTGDGVADLVVANLYEGRLYAFAGPLAARALDAARDADVVVEGTPNAYFASSLAVGRVRGGDVAELVIGTPGEPEESCVFAQTTVVVPLPLTRGTVAESAVAESAGFEATTCPGTHLVARDLTGDGVDDLLFTTTRLGAWIVPGPIDARFGPEAPAFALPLAHVYGYAAEDPAVLLDTPAASTLVLVSEGPSLAIYTLPLDANAVPRVLPLSERRLPLAGGAGVDVDGDAATDLVLVDDEWNPTRATVWLGPLAEAPRDALVLEAPEGAFAAITAGDVDGDGRDDLVAVQRSTLWMTGLR